MKDYACRPIFEYENGREIVSEVYGLYKDETGLVEYLYSASKCKDLFWVRKKKNFWPPYLPIEKFVSSVAISLNTLIKFKYKRENV